MVYIENINLDSDFTAVVIIIIGIYILFKK